MVTAALAGLGRLAAPLAGRLPGIGGSLRGLLGGGGVGAATGALGGAARSIAGLGLPGPAGSAARAFGAFTLGSAALGAGTRVLGGGGDSPAPGRELMGGAFASAGAQLGAGGGDLLTQMLASQGGIITRIWEANGTPFARLDYPGSSRRSKILFQRRDGSIGSYVPQRMIVLSRNPRAKDLAKAAKRIDRLTRSVVKAPKQTRAAADRMETGKRRRS